MDEALEVNSSDNPPSLLLDQDLVWIVSHWVHIIVEVQDSALCSHVFVLVALDLHTISLLDVVKDLVDGCSPFCSCML